MMTKGRTLMRRPEREESILTAAARVFAEKGYADTSMDEIAAAAGVSKLIIYRHFDSKQQLYERLLDRERERLRLATGGPGGFSADSLPGLLAAARADPNGFRLLFRHAAREPQFAGYSREFSKRAVAVAEEHLGAVQDPVARRWLARLVVNLAVDAIIVWLDAGEPERDAEMARWLQRMLRGMIAAVAAPR